MTNLQQSAPILSPVVLKRLWFGAPAAILAGAGVLVGFIALVPLWQTMQSQSSRLQELQSIQDQVNLMRQQLRSQEINQEKLLGQRERLYTLIAGSGDVSTLIATLDREASSSGVRLDNYEPQVPVAAAPSAAAPAAGQSKAQAPAAAASSDLQKAGLQSTGMLISARGGYGQLLNFLRRLEALNVLVIQSNLGLEGVQSSTGKKNPSEALVTMKLGLSLYSKSPTEATQPQTPSNQAAQTQPNGR